MPVIRPFFRMKKKKKKKKKKKFSGCGNIRAGTVPYTATKQAVNPVRAEKCPWIFGCVHQ